MTSKRGPREHGTHNCYVHGEDRRFSGKGCRCAPCRKANSDYETARARRVVPPFVDAEPVRRHVAELSAAGVGLKQIAKVSGVAHGTLSKLIYGVPTAGRPPSRRIRKVTEDAILAVAPAAVADGAVVDAAETWKIIGRLQRRGWTKVAIARAIGQTGPGLQLSRRQVQARHARTIAGLLNEPVPPRRGRPAPVPVEDPLAVEARRDQTRRRSGLTITEALNLDCGTAIGDRNWISRGACRGSDVPTWLFYVDDDDHESIEAARAICATCQVAAECLAYATSNRLDGIWGGTTPAERGFDVEAEAA